MFETELCQFLNMVNQHLQHQTNDLTQFEAILQALDSNIGQAEQDVAGNDKNQLDAVLQQISHEQHQLETRLQAAHTLGLSSIQQEINVLKFDLASQNFEDWHQNLAGYTQQVQSLVQQQQEIQKKIERSKEKLNALENEAKTLERRQQQARQSLEQWADKQRPQELRRQCLEVAQNILILRQGLQQQISNG